MALIGFSAMTNGSNLCVQRQLACMLYNVIAPNCTAICAQACFMVQVMPDMTVTDIRHKLWNITGIAPAAQRIVLASGMELQTQTDLDSCGLQHDSVLHLSQR